MKPIILILLLTMGCFNWSAGLTAAEPTLKCEQYWGCTVEDALTDEFVAQLQQEDMLSESPLKLINVSDADLQKLPALKDRVVVLIIERSKKVTDLTPVAKLIGLKSIQLDLLDNLSDLAPLATLTNLTKVSIKQVPFTSYAFLQPLNQLEQLIFSLSPREPSDISALAGKTHLKRLELGNFGATVNINDISPLQDATQLEELVLYGIAAHDLAALSAMKHLKRLILRGVTAKDFTPVGELSELIELDVSNTAFSEYSALENCPKLETLDATSSTFQALDALEHLPQLKSLHLAKTPVQHWESLKSAKNLEFLAVGDTSFSDLSLLSGLEKLRVLDLSRNTVTHPEAINTLPNLVTLGIKGVQGIQDITIFSTLPQLKTFIMDEDQFPQSQIDALKAAKRGLNISYY